LYRTPSFVPLVSDFYSCLLPTHTHIHTRCRHTAPLLSGRYVTADPALVHISSSRVREAVAAWTSSGKVTGNERTRGSVSNVLSGLVPASIEEVVAQLYARAKVTEG
jgi:hypothetical protein